jgi:hypothetical protein
MHGPDKKNHSTVVDIPVSWFNFITLMLLTPEKFDWAKSFLSSQLWNILKEPLLSEDSIQFAIPDKCVTTEAPLCINLYKQDEASPTVTPSKEVLITPKRKRRDGKSVLVESEVRRSPRLVMLNDGYKSHVIVQTKNVSHAMLFHLLSTLRWLKIWLCLSVRFLKKLLQGKC